jgi:hypothetical protein
MKMWLRTAKSSFKDRDDDTMTIMQLVHGVNTDLGEWKSICGYGFLSYETRWETSRPVTCVWCLAGMLRNEGRWTSG